MAGLEEVVVIIVGSVCECYILTKRKKKEKRGGIYESSGFLICLYSCSFLSDATLLKCALCVCALECRGIEPAEPGQKGWRSENVADGHLSVDGITVHVRLLAHQTAEGHWQPTSTLSEGMFQDMTLNYKHPYW